MESEGEDAMRRAVGEDVHDYVNKVFLGISPNITINGLPPTSDLVPSILSSTITTDGVIEEHEPFNHRLFEKAKANARKEEDLIEEIAALRRKVPEAVVEGMRRRFKEEMEADEEGLRALGEGMRETEGEADVLGLVKLERQADVEAGWERSVKGLERVVKGMPEMVARCERAERAEVYVNGMDGR
ncbi:Uncharacterized protein BP5553_09006 [Venustampulla echinocandica]|uniref:Kinetochore protein mis14 n=1 Tax=Venustampulla echinocandica TaxID=2656787 RepID=A0A370TDJ9_9HELO|nr:Uncharacterized protein BP5553_09006 [Venustampulla echinocandica]RDL32550.1 Uncharacterized protein BP5553_09006 [Venustampulla echinocandica]